MDNNTCIANISNASQNKFAFYQKLQKTGSPQVQKAQTTELLLFIIYLLPVYLYMYLAYRLAVHAKHYNYIALHTVAITVGIEFL